MIDRQNRSQCSHSFPIEQSTMGHFDAVDWRKASTDEASKFSEEVLLSAARAGQEWAFAELCARCSRRILYMLQRITKNREDAEDAMQESMLKAFIHLGEFNQSSSFAAWLTRISINSALMHLRRKRARPEISTDVFVEDGEKQSEQDVADVRPNPEDHFIHQESHCRLRSAVSKLPNGYRRIVENLHRTDASMKEIAGEAGITIAAVKSRLSRARQLLRSSLLT
jgi:RNA polymerase sigma-70 factor, ECF subfamily